MRKVFVLVLMAVSLLSFGCATMPDGSKVVDMTGFSHPSFEYRYGEKGSPRVIQSLNYSKMEVEARVGRSAKSPLNNGVSYIVKLPNSASAAGFPRGIENYWLQELRKMPIVYEKVEGKNRGTRKFNIGPDGFRTEKTQKEED